MADQKDQDPTPPADPTFIPLPKGSMAEKSLAGKASEPEAELSDSSSEDEISGIHFKKMKIEELKQKAYYSLLKAFKAETSTISDKRNQIIQKLMKEWEISQETHISVADKIEKDLATRASHGKGTQSSGHKSGSSWGNVNPLSLIGKWISLRYSDEDPCEELLIKDYDEKMDKHLLVKPGWTDMEMSDFLNWMDIRTVMTEADIKLVADSTYA